jgi:hypothetical protein
MPEPEIGTKSHEIARLLRHSAHKMGGECWDAQKARTARPKARGQLAKNILDYQIFKTNHAREAATAAFS